MAPLETGEFEQIRAALLRGCGLNSAAITPYSAASLIDELAHRVDHLLRHDAEKLMYYLYSLDVQETAVTEAFADDRPAHALARAILDREAARLRTRKQYEQQSRSGVPPLPPDKIEPDERR